MDCFGLGMSGEMMNFTIVDFVSEVCIVYQGESSLLSPYPSARTLPKIFRCKKGTCVTKILWKILRIITRGFWPFLPSPKINAVKRSNEEGLCNYLATRESAL